jgi:hypothetical protein
MQKSSVITAIADGCIGLLACLLSVLCSPSSPPVFRMPCACMVAPFESRHLSRPLTENYELTFTPTVYRYPFAVFLFLGLVSQSLLPSSVSRSQFAAPCLLIPVSLLQSPRFWKLLSRRQRGVKYSLLPAFAFKPRHNSNTLLPAHLQLRTHSFQHLTTRTHFNPRQAWRHLRSFLASARPLPQLPAPRHALAHQTLTT